MIRPATLIWATLVVIAGLLLYKVKHDVRALERELAELNRALQERRDRLHVLEAEWSLLNEPERLRDLAARHLSLVPLRAEQLARASEAIPRLALAPARAVPSNAEPVAAVAAAEAAGTPSPAVAMAGLPLPPAFPEPGPRTSPMAASAASAAAYERRGAATAPAATPRGTTPALAEPPAVRPGPRPLAAPAGSPPAVPAVSPPAPGGISSSPPAATQPRPAPVAPSAPQPALASALGAQAGALPPPVAGSPR